MKSGPITTAVMVQMMEITIIFRNTSRYLNKLEALIPVGPCSPGAIAVECSTLKSHEYGPLAPINQIQLGGFRATETH